MNKVVETKGERTARIIRTIVRYLHDVSIRQLAMDINCNYMQLYYCSVGKTFELSEDLVIAFKQTYPQFSEKFLRYGVGRLCENSEEEDFEYEEQEVKPAVPEIPMVENPATPIDVNPVGMADMARLFSRVLDLVDCVRTRDEEIRVLKQDLINIQQRLSRLEARLNEPK